MSSFDKQACDEQHIVRYLLGLLGAQEAERLDEISFTDHEFAARLEVAENDLVDSYAKGELAGKALEQFKSFYLSSPKRRKKVRFAEAFQTAARRDVAKDGIHQQSDSGEQDAANESQSRQSSRKRFWFIKAPALQWGTAAIALILLAAGGWLGFENARLRKEANRAESAQQHERDLQQTINDMRSSASKQEKELQSLRDQLARLGEQRSPDSKQTPSTPQRLNIVSFTLSPQTRGASQVAKISIPSDANYVSMQLELEPSDFASYRAQLKAQPDGKVVWKSANVRAKASAASRSIAVTLRAAILKSQRYIMEVYGVSPTGASEIISSYPFSVVKQ